MKRLNISINPAIVKNTSFEVNVNGGFTFTNKGNTIITIDDDMTIEPGQSWAIGISEACSYTCEICQSFNIVFGNISQDANPIKNRMEIIFLNVNDI